MSPLGFGEQFIQAIFRKTGRMACLVLLLAAVVYNVRLDSMENFHPDEAEWIFAGKLSTDLFFYHHDTANPLWNEQLGTWGNFNPQVGKYIIGLSVNLFGRRGPLTVPSRALTAKYAAKGLSEVKATQLLLMSDLGYRRPYAFKQDVAWNVHYNRVPPPALLADARRGIVLCTLVAGLFLFLLTRLTFGGRVGLVALVAFLANPVIFSNGRRAMTDLPCLMFVMIGLYGLLRTIQAAREGGRGRWLYPLLCGGAWGLAVSVKLSALAPYAAAVGFALGLFALSSKRGARLLPEPLRAQPFSRAPLAWLAIALLLLPPALFMASNPFLYRHPFGFYLGFPTKFHFMLHLGRMVAGYQPGAGLGTLGAKAASTVKFLYTDASLTHKAIGAGLGALFFPIGLAWLARDLARDGIGIKRAEGILVAGFLMVTLAVWVATVAWLPVNWERFYIPLLPSYCVVLAYGLGGLVRLRHVMKRQTLLRARSQAPTSGRTEKPS